MPEKIRLLWKGFAAPSLAPLPPEGLVLVKTVTFINQVKIQSRKRTSTGHLVRRLRYVVA